MKPPVETLTIGLVLSTLLIAPPGEAWGQSDEVSIARSVRLHSSIMNEERPLYLSLPLGYEESAREYPVLYILDGSAGRIIRSAGMIRYLGSDPRVPIIPDMIVVAIANTNRGRDLSVTPLEQLPESGNADRFIRFLVEELIPFVDSEYRTTGYRLLSGGSAAGEVAAYVLFSHPEAFDAVIAASPALGFSGELNLDRARSFFRSGQATDRALFMPYYEGDFTVITEWIPKLVEIIEAEAPPTFRWSLRTFPGKAHVPPTHLEDGLRWLFREWKQPSPPTITPASGTFPDGSRIQIEIEGEEGEIRYTLNGEEPTRRSDLYTGPIPVAGPVHIKAKAFDGKLSESRTSEVELSHAPLIPALYSPVRGNPGLKCAYFERLWYLLPDSLGIEPDNTSVCEKIDLTGRERDYGYILRFEGHLHVPEDGTYLFYLSSGSDAKLFLDDRLVVDHDGSRPNQDPDCDVEEVSAVVGLEAGYHAIRLLYTNAWFDTFDLVLSWSGPGFAKQEVPPDALTHPGGTR